MTGFKILPPRPGLCQECATAHDSDQPHNALSLHYQYAFRAKHERWPTWKDAIAHCKPLTRDLWERELRVGGHWTGWDGEKPPGPDGQTPPGKPLGSVKTVALEDPVSPARTVRIVRKKKKNG